MPPGMTPVERSRLTHQLDIAVRRIGQGSQPLVVVDNFFPNPEVLCSAARVASFVPARNAYPGLRAPLPDFYWSEDQLNCICSPPMLRG